MLVSVNLPGARSMDQGVAYRRRPGAPLSARHQHSAERASEYREITDQLYGGDIHKRIRQEIVLGIGGLRALKKLGIRPTVYHMNEGHSAFLAIERIRVLMEEHKLSISARRWKRRG